MSKMRIYELARELGVDNKVVIDKATELGMSERTLVRRLSELDVPFATIVDRLRQDLAWRYLAEDELSLTQIAFLLGYASPSAFSVAYRRWTGRSPRKGRADFTGKSLRSS